MSNRVVCGDRSRFAINAAIASSPHTRLGSRLFLYLNDYDPLETDKLCFPGDAGPYVVAPNNNDCFYEFAGQAFLQGYCLLSFQWSQGPPTPVEFPWILPLVKLSFGAAFLGSGVTAYGWLIANGIPPTGARMHFARRFEEPIEITSDAQQVELAISIGILSKWPTSIP